MNFENEERFRQLSLVDIPNSPISPSDIPETGTHPIPENFEQHQVYTPPPEQQGLFSVSRKQLAEAATSSYENASQIAQITALLDHHNLKLIGANVLSLFAIDGSGNIIPNPIIDLELNTGKRLEHEPDTSSHLTRIILEETNDITSKDSYIRAYDRHRLTHDPSYISPITASNRTRLNISFD